MKRLLQDAYDRVVPDLLKVCESAPIIRMDDTLETFKERYCKWYRESLHTAVVKAKGDV